MKTSFKYDDEIYDLADLGVHLSTVSFYTALDDDGNAVDAPDTEFGTCDLTGIYGALVNCIALDAEDNVVQFQVLDTIVGGALGRAAGAF